MVTSLLMASIKLQVITHYLVNDEKIECDLNGLPKVGSIVPDYSKAAHPGQWQIDELTIKNATQQQNSQQMFFYRWAAQTFGINEPSHILLWSLAKLFSFETKIYFPRCYYRTRNGVLLWLENNRDAIGQFINKTKVVAHFNGYDYTLEPNIPMVAPKQHKFLLRRFEIDWKNFTIRDDRKNPKFYPLPEVKQVENVDPDLLPPLGLESWVKNEITITPSPKETTQQQLEDFYDSDYLQETNLYDFYEDLRDRMLPSYDDL